VQSRGIPIHHHVVPEHGADTSRRQRVKQRLDVVEIQRAFAMPGDVSPGVGIRAEGAGLVAAKVKTPHARKQRQHNVHQAPH